MQIRQSAGSMTDSDLSTVDMARDSSACSRDSCFFSSLLDNPDMIRASSTGSVLSPAVAEAINPLQTSRTRMAKLLKSNNKQLDIAEFRKLPGLLANIQITSQMLVKCLAKTTQGIEKISNLQ